MSANDLIATAYFGTACDESTDHIYDAYIKSLARGQNKKSIHMPAIAYQVLRRLPLNCPQRRIRTEPAKEFHDN